MKYWRTQLADACMLMVVPALAAVLPWRLGWRWLRWWSRRQWGPFADAANAALPIAERWLPVGDPVAFRERMRLLWLMDCCDLYMSMVRRRRTRPAWYVEQVGSWPSTPTFVALGFHYAIGHDVLRTLAAANHNYTFVSRQWRREDYSGHPVRYWYSHLRIHDVARIGGMPVAYRPGVRSVLERVLQEEKAVVVALVDLPPRLAPHGRRKVRLLNRESSLPGGMIELAREAGVPVVPYWVEFDEKMYKRRVRIGEPIATDDVDAALARVAELLDKRIREAPHAWMLWPELPGWVAEEVAGVDASDVDDQAL